MVQQYAKELEIKPLFFQVNEHKKSIDMLFVVFDIFLVGYVVRASQCFGICW
jgi:hypothetical protein